MANLTVDLDSLLDSTLDDLKDAPQFKHFPAGAHRILLSLEVKSVNDRPVVEAKLKYVQAEELADPSEEAPAQNDETQCSYFLDTDFGQGKFKELASPIRTALGVTSNREIIEATKDLECIVITGVRADKKNVGRFFTDIKELAVV